MGQNQLNGEGKNSLNLETLDIGASYSVKTADLSNPTAIYDSINACFSGRNYGDTLKAQLSQSARRAQQALQRTRARTPQRTNTRTTMMRTGARGR
ncbi:MAG: hypothetical protein IJ770_00430 [Alphaproteobacteria bacterium]|nr:hypothetical protein [Alphaproteobacteria bacterium]